MTSGVFSELAWFSAGVLASSVRVCGAPAPCVSVSAIGFAGRRHPSASARIAAGVGVGAAPAVALAEAQQRLAQHWRARIAGRGQKGGAGHFGERARFGRRDDRTAAIGRLPAIDQRAAPLQKLHPGPHRVEQRGDGARVAAAGLRRRAGHLGDADVGQEIRLSRKFRDIGFVQLAALGQGVQRLDPLAQFVAAQQTRIIRTQRVLEHIGEPIEQRLVDGFAGLLGLDEKGVRPGGQRDVAGRARPEGDEPVAVDGLFDRLRGRLHIGGDAPLQPRRGEDRRKALQRETRARQRETLLRAAVGIFDQSVQSRDELHDGGVAGQHDLA